MKYRIRKILVAALLSASAAIHPMLAATATTSWETDGTKVTRNGEQFLFKGVNYAPVPFGASPNFSPPYGSYFIPKAAPIFNRDIPNLRAMGANAIRLYAGTPETINGLDLGDYKDFLDKLWNDGVDPIHVFIMVWYPDAYILADSPEFAGLKAKFTQLMERWKDHPAIAGMVVGNEVEGDSSNYNNPQFWNGIGQVATAIKSVAPDKLTLIAIVDGAVNNVDPKIQAAYNHRDLLQDLDIFGINCYRGPTLGVKENNSVFKGYTNSWPDDQKPLLITEFGVAWGTGGAAIREADSAAQQQKGRDYIKGNWFAIRDNYLGQESGVDAVSTGGFVFSYVDEWYKIETLQNGQVAPSPFTHDSNAAAPGGKVNYTGLFPGGQWDEEWFGLFRIDPSTVNPSVVTWDINNLTADTLIPRASYQQLQDLWKPQRFKTSVLSSKARTPVRLIPARPLLMPLTPLQPANGAGESGGAVTESYLTKTWMGIVDETHFPWVYHNEKEWIYIDSVSPDDVWFFDSAFNEWFWTSEEIHPWRYRPQTDSWVFYYLQSKNPRVFFDNSTGETFVQD